MTRLESGAIQVRKEWHSIEEIGGTALARLGGRLEDRPESGVGYRLVAE